MTYACLWPLLTWWGDVMRQVSTLIGYGSPNKADTHDVHGAPLGKDETAATRANLK